MGDLLDQTRLLAHAARHPVERAEVIENRPAETELRVGGERPGLLRMVLADRIEQPDDSPRDEVAVLDVRRLAGREALHHAADERQMPPEDFLARARHRGGMRERRAPTTDPRPSGWSEGGVGAAHARAVAFGSRR